MFAAVEDYPRTLGEFEARFASEAACRAYLTQLRWPSGFVCPRCRGTKAWPARGVLWHCAACGRQTSVTAGTIFHKTRTPLSSWFWAIYRMSHDKKGISAMQLAKEVGVSYPTAWLMLHKIRKAMSERDQGYRLSGLVEVDEGYVGGEEHGEGRRGRGKAGVRNKSVVAVAVERRGAGKPGQKPVPGFAALEVIPDASAETMEKFLTAKVRAGSHILSDGWRGYRRLKQKGFEHTATPISTQDEQRTVFSLGFTSPCPT